MTSPVPQARATWPICSRCHAKPAREGQRWCRACASAYQRDYGRGVPRAFQRFVRQRAAEYGIELPEGFFDVARKREARL